MGRIPSMKSGPEGIGGDTDAALDGHTRAAPNATEHWARELIWVFVRRKG